MYCLTETINKCIKFVILLSELCICWKTQYDNKISKKANKRYSINIVVNVYLQMLQVKTTVLKKGLK